MSAYIPLIGRTPSDEDAHPFGPDFFRRKFPDYLSESCFIGEEVTTVFELVLSTGAVIDVSRILEIDDDYILLAAFLDSRTCEDEFVTYIRYDTILQINLREERGETRLGFNTSHHPKVTASRTRTIGVGARDEQSGEHEADEQLDE